MYQGLEQCSIQDIADNWEKETDEPNLLITLVKAIMGGHLLIVDPVIELTCLDSQKDIDEFLSINSSYEDGYFPSGESAILNTQYIRALYEFSRFGKSITYEVSVLHTALQMLFIRREDLKNWLIKTDRHLPEFWFTGVERGQNPTSKMRQAIKNLEEEVSERIGYRKGLHLDLEEIAERIRLRIPVLLHFWFKHDNWGKNEGLMLLSGFGPETIFDSYESIYGEEIRKVAYLETLDGYGRDPADCGNSLRKFATYESLWDSGNHPEKADPQYFISWAISKKIEPEWLEWAINEGYCARNSEINKSENREREISGKSETSYLNIIGALIGLILEKKNQEGERFSLFEDQQAIINAIRDNYGTEGGLSSSNLQKKFASANQSIKSK
jgi:hypothetical protein